MNRIYDGVFSTAKYLLLFLIKNKWIKIKFWMDKRACQREIRKCLLLTKWMKENSSKKNGTHALCFCAFDLFFSISSIVFSCYVRSTLLIHCLVNMGSIHWKIFVTACYWCLLDSTSLTKTEQTKESKFHFIH